MSQTVSINTKYKGEMAFEATVGDHKISIDAAEEVGGKNSGTRPKPLMLVALAGCTGIDVVSILRKMKVTFDDLDIDVEAKMADDHPKYYTEMRIIYRFKGKDLDRSKIEKAVNLSKDSYCGVSALYAKAIPLTFEIIIE